MAIRMRQLTTADAPALLTLRDGNRAYFRRWEPTRSPEWFTADAQRAWVAQPGVVLGAFDEAGELAGYARLSELVRGAFQNAYLGYGVGEAHAGRGVATALVERAVETAFGDELRLHRVQANVRTDNPASRRVLEKAGFRREGLALRYLELDGAWRDHDMFAVTAEERPRH